MGHNIPLQSCNCSSHALITPNDLLLPQIFQEKSSLFWTAIPGSAFSPTANKNFVTTQWPNTILCVEQVRSDLGKSCRPMGRVMRSTSVIRLVYSYLMSACRAARFSEWKHQSMSAWFAATQRDLKTGDDSFPSKYRWNWPLPVHRSSNGKFQLTHTQNRHNAPDILLFFFFDLSWGFAPISSSPRCQRTRWSQHWHWYLLWLTTKNKQCS